MKHDFDDEAPLADRLAADRPLASDQTRLVSLAKFQRRSVLCILAFFGLMAASVLAAALGIQQNTAIRMVMGFTIIGIALAGLHSLGGMVYWLTKSYLAVFLVCLMTLIYCISPFILLLCSLITTRRLKQAGIRVGLLGADPDDIRRRFERANDGTGDGAEYLPYDDRY